MRIVIFGTGGVGGCFGGHMARSGMDVTFIARGDHLRAIREHGLHIQSAKGEFVVHLAQATDDPSTLAPPDYVLMCNKTWQLEDAIEAVGPMIGPGTTIVPLLNSIEAVDMLAAAFGAVRVLGGFCYTISYVTGRGVIWAGGINRVIFGELDHSISHRTELLAQAINSVEGITAQNAPHIQHSMWKKFTWISSASAMGAITRAPASIWKTLPETRALFLQVLRETFAVAAAKGVVLGDAEFAETVAFLDGTPEGFTTSMQRDMAAGRRSELMHQIGYVVRQASELGLPAPASETIFNALLPSELRAQGKLSFN